jgi:hypothetical protein
MPRPIRLCNYTRYIHYTYYINYTTYTNHTHYFQVHPDLGLADHVWQDKRTLIAQSVDNLGDQFRPAMRAAWFYTSVVRTQRTTRPMPALLWEKASWWPKIESTPLLDATNNVPPWCSLLDAAIGLVSAMNSNPKKWIFFGIIQIIEKIIAIIVI